MASGLSARRVPVAACAAYAAAVPLSSLLVVTDAAHPQLASLLPVKVAAVAAGCFFVLVLAVGAGALISERPSGPIFLSVGGFAVAANLGSLLGFDPLPGLIASIALSAVVACGVAIERAARDGDWPPILCAFLWSGIAFCAVALIAMLTRHPVGLYAFAHGRAIGTFENPNELAEFALAVSAAGIGAVLGAPRLRILGWAAFGIATLTLIGTGSRSGELAYAIGALVLLAGLRPRRGIALVVLVLALGGLAAGFALDRRHNPAETDSRLAAWAAGIRTVALYPLTGVGIGAYYRVYPYVRGLNSPGPGDPIAYDPHNFYLSVASETGLLGLGGLIASVAAIVSRLVVALTTAPALQRRLSLALGAGLAADACHLMFNGFALSVVLWAALAALALGIARSGDGRAA